jgi:hypothetical protein
MEDLNRRITFFGPKPSRAIQRAIQKQIEKWIDRKKGLLSLEKESRYQVRFEHNPSDNSCFCHAKIQIGTCTWECHDVGRTPQESLFLALKHPTIRFVRPDLKVQYVSPAQPVGAA